MTNAAMKIVVMGVSGSGKSTVGTALAELLGLGFVDADDLHPASNVAKMAAGTPLTDDDRWPWLDVVGERLAESSTGLVIACSALRRSYRDAIRDRAPDTRFVLLTVDHDALQHRLEHRPGHFMPPSLLDSQLATLEPLEPDENGVTVSSQGGVAATAKAAAQLLAS